MNRLHALDAFVTDRPATSEPASPGVDRIPGRRSPALALLAAAGGVVSILILFAAADVGGAAALWEHAHWTIAAAAALGAGLIGTSRARGRARLVRASWTVALAVWLVGFVWVIASHPGVASGPSLADIFVLTMAVPGLLALVAAVRSRLTTAEEASVYLDAGLVVAVLTAMLLYVQTQGVTEVGGLAALVAVANPILFIGLGTAAFVGLVAVGHPVRPAGAYAIVVGLLAIGVAYLAWTLPNASVPMPGSPAGHLFSVGTLLLGFGAGTWSATVDLSPGIRRVTQAISRTVAPIGASVAVLFVTFTHRSWGDLPIEVCLFAAGACFIVREALLLRERSLMLDQVRALHVENARLVADLRRELADRARVQAGLMETTRAAAVGQLASGVAHQVNNPLSGVLGYAELLLADLPAHDPRRADLEVIRDEALRARTIIWALRDFARPAEQQVHATDLNGLVARTVALLRYPSSRQGVMIEVASDELPMIELDPQAIQQAILNVLTNAIQATPRDGRIDIETCTQGDRALIRVVDQGVGMDDETMTRAFEPFFASRPEPGAIGLGLTIARDIVERHGGTIRLASRPTGGTTAEILLPLVQPTADTRTEGPVGEGPI